MYGSETENYTAISGSEKDIHEALRKDLGKSGFESYMCETGMVLEEISYMIKHNRTQSWKAGAVFWSNSQEFCLRG